LPSNTYCIVVALKCCSQKCIALPFIKVLNYTTRTLNKRVPFDLQMCSAEQSMWMPSNPTTNPLRYTISFGQECA
ncbi:unnamed protein product, partial [Ceratitis capitata]